MFNFSKFLHFFVAIVILCLFLSCSENSNPFGDDANDDPLRDGWLIPKSEVVDGGPGKDGIPSIDNPNFTNVKNVDFIPDERMIIGIQLGDEIRAYPHQILDWHEIVNDQIGDKFFSLLYCPLTGTGMAWDRKIPGKVNEFGVSGLLFRNNLIAYDRNTDSYWSQMQMRGVNGHFFKHDVESFQVVETTWETWKQLYPESVVLQLPSNNRNYDGYAYGRNYPTAHGEILFPVRNFDDRLENKDRVHGIIDMEPGVSHGAVKVYAIDDFGDGIALIEDKVGRTNYLIAGSKEFNLATSFKIPEKSSTDIELQFEALQEQLPIIMRDNEGNYWDVFGNAVEGPRKGDRLTAARAYTGYWFAWADFFTGLEVYGYD